MSEVEEDMAETYSGCAVFSSWHARLQDDVLAQELDAQMVGSRWSPEFAGVPPKNTCEDAVALAWGRRAGPYDHIGSSQVEEKRPVLRRWKHVLFQEKTVKHDRMGQPVVETGTTQTRSSDDSKSFNVEDKAVHDRTGQPLVSCHINDVPDGSRTRSSHESTSFNVGDDTFHGRTGQPVVNRDESGHEQTMLNEVNMDFRILGLPHSVVKQAESSRVRELVEKIENHPDRHALQLDLQQDKEP